MQKINFATKISVPATLRVRPADVGNGLKAVVSAEINSAKLQIAYKEFSKTPAEHMALKLAKVAWKLNSQKLK